MSTFTPLPVGTIWQGRYKAIEDPNSNAADKHLLGRGGMGAVYLAYDEQLHCEVAVKQMLLSADADFVNAFKKEAQLLANLSHPALPRVSGLFAEHNSYFFVMELIRGDNLLETMDEADGKLPFDIILNVALQLLDALDYLHTQKTPIIHKDIKPENLKLTMRGQLKLLDFGLAKGSAGLMTEHGSSILKGNTPAYASPEQDADMPTDARSDLYSAAATLFRLACGKLPPHCRIRFQHIAFKKPDPLRFVSEINAEVPQWFAEILHKALSLSSDERFESVAEMAVAIQQRQLPVKRKEKSHIDTLVEVKIGALIVDPNTNTPIVVLKGIDSDNILPIWVGEYEANAIALEIEKIVPQAPMTHDLLRNFIVETGFHVKRIAITELRDNIFYALIELSDDQENIISLEARPSDAIALALRLDCAIYVEQKLMQLA